MDHLLMVLLLLWSSGLQAEGAQCETSAKADIVLLVDGSWSINPESFQDVRSFITNIVSAFDVGPDRVQIALVQYSDHPRTHWYLNTHQSKEALLENVSRIQQRGGNTYTGHALSYTLQNIFQPNVGMRADTENIVVLITDGQSTDDVDSPSQELKDAGIEVYVVGFNTARATELRSIASDPDEDHVYMIKDSQLLPDIVDNLSIHLCFSSENSGAQCETSAKADIVLLVDGSWSIGLISFQDVLSFITNIVSTFDIGPDRVQIALVQYSYHPRTHWYLNTHQSKEALLENVSRIQLLGGNTYTGFNTASETDLRSIASDPDQNHVFIVEDSQLLRDIVNNFTISLCDSIKSSESVRLVGGSSPCAGALEVKRGEWRPVFGSNWTLTSADVMCRELDCGSAASTGRRNESNRAAWQISPDCVESGSALRECLSSGSSSSIIKITCSDSVGLVNGTSLCSGGLEVKSDQSNQSNQSNQWWSLVCEAGFDQQDAEVVCRELGCGAPSVLWGALYGEVEAPMLTEEFQCEGNESALLDCRSSGSARNTCSPGEAVGLTCSEPVRLVGGSSRCAGALEVKQGDWRPVYDSNWTLTSAAVVCRELHCGSVVSTGLRNDSTLRSTWEIRPDCVQSGSALRECVTPMWSSFFLEVTCSGPTVSYIGLVRLVLLSLALLLFITALCVTHQTTRGQKQPMELDDYKLGVHRAEEEGGQAAE
ncbi:scavenger receptor cysteine-rich type 1 protein M160-like isoform X3 [Acanthopagrus latus]|uniref:scavenger receptor cysteine-rich type 1 protein M160-like isoform X3 n=1 Tax=Acanthopagrus latus TaxID=8177 RepID=UPI00187CDCF1|nr:scavenger receptor cysteine-rich type 1 protein M160-like isoform X3 [Acanthopagrus latus]